MSMTFEPVSTRAATAGKWLAIIGSLMQLGPLVGIACTVIGMMQAFDSLSSTGPPADSSQLSSSISMALVATVAGIGVGLIGAILLAIAIFATSFRAAWLFWTMILAGFLMLFAPPIGTAIGIALLGMALVKRRELLAKPSPDPRAASSGLA